VARVAWLTQTRRCPCARVHHTPRHRVIAAAHPGTRRVRRTERGGHLVPAAEVPASDEAHRRAADAPLVVPAPQCVCMCVCVCVCVCGRGVAALHCATAPWCVSVLGGGGASRGVSGGHAFHAAVARHAGHGAPVPPRTRNSACSRRPAAAAAASHTPVPGGVQARAVDRAVKRVNLTRCGRQHGLLKQVVACATCGVCDRCVTSCVVRAVVTHSQRLQGKLLVRAARRPRVACDAQDNCLPPPPPSAPVQESAPAFLAPGVNTRHAPQRPPRSSPHLRCPCCR
jgi:hypothetical protein